MKLIIEKYLNKLNKENMDFAMDSISSGKSFKMRYPQIEDDENIINKINTKFKKRILIDFDRTIHKYSKGYDSGEIYDSPFKNTKLYINKLKDMNYEIVIFSSRVSKEEFPDTYLNSINDVKNWLNKYEIYFDKITSDKLPSILIIDDSSYRFMGNWDEEFPKILNILKQNDNRNF